MVTASMKWQAANPNKGLRGSIKLPGDKSVSHRSLIFSSLAEGQSQLRGVLEGEDVLCLRNALQAMGVPIERTGAGCYRVSGVGMRGLQAPNSDLYLGNSGTAMRLLAGLLSAQAFDSCLRGDASLSLRPMARVTQPLKNMGALIDTDAGMPPLQIHGGRPLQGLTHHLKVASAQLKSALLLAGLYAKGETIVIEPAVTRDHSERMLAGFAYPVEKQGLQTRITGGGALKACDVDVPSDLSSAAFFIVAASIIPESDLLLAHVGINPTRTGILTILRAMGANLDIFPQGNVGGEPVADIRIRSAQLTGIDIQPEWVPLAIDEFPALFVAAACAKGCTRLRGAAELRVKESDRIDVMAKGLSKMGVDLQVYEDGIDIHGGSLTAAELDSHGDHRCAMSFVVASQMADKCQIDNCENVATSFPSFIELAQQVGMEVSICA